MKKREANPVTYKTEEMLKQEARLRAEQQARLDAAKPPPSERKKKAENFWYHYKWHVVAGVVAIALVVVFARDILRRTDPDATIVLAVSTPVAQESLEALRQAIEAVAQDGNGDGRVEIRIDSIHLTPEPTEEALAAMSEQERVAAGSNTDYASAMKLTTVLAAGLDPIFLLDNAVYTHLGSMGDPEQGQSSAFAPLPVASATGDRLPVSDTVLSGVPGCEAFAELAFSLRPYSKNGDADDYAYCERLLQALTA